MAKLAVDRFISLVERSGLVEPGRLTSLVADWKRTATAAELDDAASCGAFLVEADALTAWQCHKLLEGRHRGFMLGNYKLLDHLGSGGMSNVYLAEHVLMQRRVAIKVLPEHRVSDAEYLARFRFEGQAVAALDHPNIVRAYDLGSEGRIHYLVMEYVEGCDLQELVERRGPLPCHLAAKYIAQAAAGLEHAHRAGLVHRDIKPANLLVDPRGVVKLLDLGLAKSTAETFANQQFAREDQVLGTAAYFAPEQASGSHSVDARADIYGLGCTLYFLLTGHPPFGGETTGELMRAHQRELAASVSIVRPDAPRALVEICQRMMAKRADDRFQSAADVAATIIQWLDAERASGKLTNEADVGAWFGTGIDSIGVGDTLASVQETARLNSKRSGPSSHVIPMQRNDGVLARTEPPQPPTPPVVPPPRDAPRAVVSSVTTSVRAVPTSEVNHQSFGAQQGAPTPRIQTANRRRKRAPSVHWWWALLVAALVLSAGVMALVAFAS